MDLERNRRVTIKDIARLAGVSVATVSNVLAGRNKYSQDTKERVEAIVRQHGFHPEASARSLKHRRTHTLGLLIPVLEGPGHLEDNPFYWELTTAVEAEGREQGYRVLIAQVNPTDDLGFVVERNLDGLILTGAFEDYPVLERARGLGIPVVLVDSYVDQSPLQVRVNDYRGGYLAARHLIDLGHRSIGMVSGTRKERGVHHERYRGFRDACREASIPLRPEWLLEEPVSVEGGRRAASRLFDLAEQPTALFASADTLAFGVYLTARERSVLLPDQLSVIGFDDLPLARYLTPPLTSVRQDTRRKGVEAVRLITRTYERGRAEPETVEIDVALSCRESTAPPLRA